MIRPGKFGDIPRLSELMTEVHARSIYAERATLDLGRFKEICRQALTGHGRLSCLFVAEQGGIVHGFIIGGVDRLYGVTKELFASDLFTYCGSGADPRDAGRLVDALVAWAYTVPNCIEIQLAVSDAVTDHRRSLRLLERKGLRRHGAIYRKEITHVRPV